MNQAKESNKANMVNSKLTDKLSLGCCLMCFCVYMTYCTSSSKRRSAKIQTHGFVCVCVCVCEGGGTS